jgi:hypothetical protein
MLLSLSTQAQDVTTSGQSHLSNAVDGARVSAASKVEDQFSLSILMLKVKLHENAQRHRQLSSR